MEVGDSCLNGDQGEMVLRAGQDGRMDDWQRRIFYCKSPLIEHGVISWILITFSAPCSCFRVKWSRPSLFCTRDERIRRFRCSALQFVRGVEGGWLSFFFWVFLIWGRLAGWPQSSLLMWMGVGVWLGEGGGGSQPVLSQVLHMQCKFRAAHHSCECREGKWSTAPLCPSSLFPG